MRGRSKTLEGVVVSNKMQKTVVVEVGSVYRHPLYQKVMRTTKNYKAHDEKSAYKIGDQVQIMRTRPLSGSKCWRVVGKVTAK